MSFTIAGSTGTGVVSPIYDRARAVENTRLFDRRDGWLGSRSAKELDVLDPLGVETTIQVDSTADESGDAISGMFNYCRIE
jgi:hypothetical protein